PRPATRAGTRRGGGRRHFRRQHDQPVHRHPRRPGGGRRRGARRPRAGAHPAAGRALRPAGAPASGPDAGPGGRVAMITVREAAGGDVPAIRDIFLASYGTTYSDPRYYDEALLTRLVYSDDSLLLVAEDTKAGRVVGTASVDLEVGAHSDLVGEFCR